MQNGISKPRAGVNKGDHPPITPLKAKDSWLSGGDINYILVIWIRLSIMASKYKFLKGKCFLKI